MLRWLPLKLTLTVSCLLIASLSQADTAKSIKPKLLEALELGWKSPGQKIIGLYNGE